ncbi:MAG TPA: hypothetical protein ENJ89_06630 [Caldithrix abyssi]|uniref:Pyrrolo-quinoline quinone repeat domain-containing protein n=1 Tax=Caldithrix abyssi TaxID=187145 RepID=A0A7V5PPH6_CALAY|nr:hypothetical protein [Caldithrix abyssi]
MNKYIKNSGIVVILLVELILSSCQKPALNVRDLHAPVIISTENINFFRNNFLPVPMSDSLTWMEDISLNSTTTSTLCAKGGNLVFTTHNGFLYTLNGKTFNQKQNTKIGKWMNSAPTILDGMAFISGSTGKYGLIAYDLFRGKVVWKEYGDFSDGAPVVFDGYVYHLTSEGKISILEKRTGKKVKTLYLEHDPVGSIAGNGEKLIAACRDGYLVCYDLKTAGQIWNLNLGAPIYNSPVFVNDSLVVVGNYLGKVAAINVQTGRILWQQKTNGNILNPLSADGERIYVPTSNGRISALSVRSGALQWSYQTQTPPCVPMLVTRGKLWIGTSHKWLHILDKSNGKEIRSILLPGRPSSMPAFINHHMVIGIEFRELAVYEVRHE